MDERLRQRLNRKLAQTSLSNNITKTVAIKPAADENVTNLSNDTNKPGDNADKVNNDEQYYNYVYLQEEPRFSTLESVFSDPTKLALILLFGVSVYALFVLNKVNKNK